jgi:predicted ATPase
MISVATLIAKLLVNRHDQTEFGNRVLQMITAIELENFRGFGKRQRIEFCPITLLYGANSAGKSALLHALLFVHEFLVMRNESPERSQLGGRFVHFGSYRDLVHGGDVDASIRIKIEMYFDWNECGMDWYHGYPMDGFEQKETADTVAVEFIFESVDNRPEVSEYIFFVGNKPIVLAHLLSKREDGSKKYDCGLYGDEIEISFSYLGDHSCCPKDVEWPSETKDSIYCRGRIASGPDFIDMSYLKVEPESNRRYGLSKQRNFFLGWLVGIISQLRHNLENLVSLGPLRDIPTEFYARRRKDPSRVAAGLSAWDSLADMMPSQLETFNQWLGPDGLDLGYTMFPVIFVPAEGRTDENGVFVYSKHSIRWDLIENERGSISSEVMRRIEFARISGTTKNDNRIEQRLLPTSIGVGLSQIVPVIFHCLAPRENRRFAATFVTIEQPELHLHPKAQTRLGDLFIECFGDGENWLMNSDNHVSDDQAIIETHSEHLLLRILRRIRETTNDELPEDAPAMNPNGVAVYYFTSSNQGIEANRLRINEQGEFLDPWPDGFFEERIEELF